MERNRTERYILLLGSLVVGNNRKYSRTNLRCPVYMVEHMS
jgi:hypothetical protein